MKLNSRILLALARYYMHRERSRKEHPLCPTCTTVLPRKSDWKWDKDADLDAISEVALDSGWYIEAATGTFWFTRPTKSGNRIIVEVNNTNYLDGGVRKVVLLPKKQGECYENKT
jgi:hypothetical protein